MYKNLRTYIAGAMLVVLLASSCQKEHGERGGVITWMTVDASRTKAGRTDGVSSERLLYTLLPDGDDGQEYELEAWIGDTEEAADALTKGVPINDGSELTDQYSLFYTTAFYAGNVYQDMKNVPVRLGEDSRWHFSETYFWPGEDQLTFCSSACNGTMGEIDYNGGNPEFTYALPAPDGRTDASGHKDMLFAVDTQSYSATSDKREGEALVHFRHALNCGQIRR